MRAAFEDQVKVLDHSNIHSDSFCGMPGKLKGRVGDAPLVGCGGYANEYGAATTGGHGESLMKMTLAREVVYNMESGLDVQKSAEKAVKRMEDRAMELGYASVIAIDKDGNFGRAFNTTMMVWATVKDGLLESGLNQKDKIGESEQV